MCAPAHVQGIFAHLSLGMGSYTHPLNVHQELSIRALWNIFFRTQGDRTVTLVKTRSPSRALCARLLMYKAQRVGSRKLSSFFLLFQGIDCQNQVSEVRTFEFSNLIPKRVFIFLWILAKFQKISAPLYQKKHWYFILLSTLTRARDGFY